MFTQARPLFYLGKIPITVTGFILLLEIVGMLAYAISGSSIINVTAFQVNLVMHGEFWRFFTYAIVSPIDIMAVLGLFFFYQFGTEVEKTLGRKLYVLLSLAILLITPIIILLSHWIGLPHSDIPLFGGIILHLAIFCAFCVIHPNIPSFFLQIPIKWLGLVFLLVSVFSYISERAWGLALACLICVGLAVWIVQCKGYALIKIFPDAFTHPPFSKRRKQQFKKLKVVASTEKHVSTTSKSTFKSKLRPKVSLPPETWFTFSYSGRTFEARGIELIDNALGQNLI